MSRGKIFLIDDSEVVLDVARHTLREAGFDVETSDNPLAAARPIGKFRPDLVLVDIQMPSIQGDVVASLLRTHLPNLVILLHSDLPEEELKERAHAAGANGYLRKTSDRASFVAQVTHWMEKARA